MTPIKDRQVSGIFGWLAEKIVDGIAAIGILFGLTTLELSSSPHTGHHMHYRFVSKPGFPNATSWTDSGDESSRYVTIGLPAIGIYLSGMTSGHSYTEVPLSAYNYSGVNTHVHGPNAPLLNTSGIEL